MIEYDTFVRAQDTLRARFERIARGSRFDAILPKPGVGLVLVGGPRNARGAIPPATRMGLVAAFRSVLRAEASLQRRIGAPA